MYKGVRGRTGQVPGAIGEKYSNNFDGEEVTNLNSILFVFFTFPKAPDFN